MAALKKESLPAKKRKYPRPAKFAERIEVVLGNTTLKVIGKMEARIVEELYNEGVVFEYEIKKIKYQKPTPKESTYTPDIVLSNGIIVEVKGYFDAEDRSKHLLIKKLHPDLDIRFVFDKADKKLSKASVTTYGMWATKNGFKWAEKSIPKEWPHERSKNKKD